MTVLSEHVWDYEIILKKNAMSLQCRYLCKFPASSILSSTVPQFSAQGCAGGTPWGPRVLSCFRWKLHPPSQAWPLLSTSNRGEIAIAKCGNSFYVFENADFSCVEIVTGWDHALCQNTIIVLAGIDFHLFANVNLIANLPMIDDWQRHLNIHKEINSSSSTDILSKSDK